jgi:sporulation protein YtfJ
MKTAMESIRDMVDVNTIVGDPVEAQDGTVIMPISRVSFGFAAGGAEYGPPGRRAGEKAMEAGAGSELPFGGGSGGGVTIKPVGFLVVGQGQVRMLPVDGRAYYDRLIDLVPRVLQELQGVMRGNGGYTAPVPPTGRRLRTRTEV